MGKREDKKEKQQLMNAGTIGVFLDEQIQKNGEAASQIIQAYNGARYDSLGRELDFHGRSLKAISEYKVNPDYAEQNIKQQSGFAAELIKESRDNKKEILAGGSQRTRTTDGLGETNNTKYDHKRVNESGKVVANSGSQMKFYGIDKKGSYRVIEKIVKDDSWERYGSKIDVPSEQYDGAVQYADEKIGELQKQVSALKKKGDFQKAEDIENKIQKYKNAKKIIRKSNVSTQEAIDARVNPEVFVSKEVLGDANNAGKEAAAGAMLVTAAISVAQNMYAVISEGKGIDEAAADVIKETAKTGLTAYAIGAGGTVIKSVMQSSKNQFLRELGDTPFPSMVVSGTIMLGKSLARYGNGEIDESELLLELGDRSVGVVGAAFGQALGEKLAKAVPALGKELPGVGSIGAFGAGLVVSTVCTMIYRGVVEAARNANYERRCILEAMAREATYELRKQKEQILKYAQRQYQIRQEAYAKLFSEIENSIMHNDIDQYIASMDKFGEMFGLHLKLNTFDEIDIFMQDEDTVFVL